MLSSRAKPTRKLERVIRNLTRPPAAPVSIRRRPQPTLEHDLPGDLHPLLRRLYRTRGVSSADGCSLPLSALLPASDLTDIDLAADLLAELIRSGGSILVVGDYDADGATGSALAVLGLKALGAARVSYLVPSRFAFGYGLCPQVVEAAAAARPDLILTVDNGIASLSGVRRANELGIRVLVTDHHLPGDDLPDAAAIVNPNRPGDRFQSKHLAGVGVVFYLLAALRSRLRRVSWFRRDRPEPNLAGFLDLVALGTVADVVTLDQNNRILVEQGLRRIRAGGCRPGITALLAAAGRDPTRVTARDLAFAAGPRLNAAGRLTEMSLGVECLLTDDHNRAAAMARELDALNRRRREIEDEMKGQAELTLASMHLEETGLPPALCLFEPGWHQGVTGILAARIRERHHRPVIAFAEAEDGWLRGSARSIDGLHVRDLIDAVDRRHPGLVERFGGHAMAAGLTLKPAALEAFNDAFVAEVHREIGDMPPTPEILSDGELAHHDLNLDTACALRDGGPWGKGFPEPLFDGTFQILHRRIVGDQHLKLRLRPDGAQPTGGQTPDTIDAIGFRLGAHLEGAGDRAHLAYRLDVNDYRGEISPQLIVEHLQWTS